MASPPPLRLLSRLVPIAASLVAALAFAQAANASPCPGADSCPWTKVDVFGDVGNDEFRAPYGIGEDGSGNLYVLEQDTHRVKKLDANGGFLGTWGGQGSAEGKLSRPTDIAVDAASGGVYVTDTDNRRVQRFDTNGNFVSAWGWGVADGSAAYQICTSNCRAGSQGSGPGQFNGAFGIATDGSHVYVADANNDRIQKFTSAGAHVGGWTIPDGQAPERVTVAGGEVYVTTASDTVWRFDTNGVVDTGWDGDGVLGSSGTGAGQFDFPEGVAVDGSGVYVADGSNNRVEKFDSGGAFITMWGWGVADGADALQTCSANCQAGKIGSGAGQFFEPYAVLATGGVVWVADAYNHRLQRFGQAGAHQLTVGAPPGAGDYYFPADVAATASGHAYVADSGGRDIQELDGSGQTISRWSTGLSTPSSVTPTPKGVYASESINHVSLYDSTGGLLSQFGSTGSGQGQLNSPFGSAADAEGNVYVAERFNDRVQKFDPAGVPLALIGSSGTGDGQLRFPQDVAVDTAGNIYVADSRNHRIEKFAPTGEFLSTFGSFGTGDGQLNTPTGVAVDATGHVFVSDNFNNRIEEFDAAGSFVAKWGTLGAGPGELSDPAGLAVDSSGAVWVADRGNNRIVRFSRPAATQGTGPGGGEPAPGAGTGVDTSAPRFGLGGHHAQRSRVVARRGLALRVSASERVRVTLRAILSRRDARRLGLRARSAARSSADLAAAGTRGLRLRLTARSRRALLRVHRVRLVVRATATDPTGNRSSDSLAITLTR